MKILVTLKDIEHRTRLGGIAHYYKALRPHLGSNVSYFTVGKRDATGGRWEELKRLLADYRSFWRRLSEGVDLVTINPSLQRAGLLRDGVFLVMATLKRKKTVVFFRGWSERTAAAIDKVWRPLFLLIFGRANGMIVLSGRFEAKLRDWGYRGPVWIETTTVGSQLIDVAPSRRGASNVCNLLFLARVERDKGIYMALSAYELLLETNVKARLTIVGDGTELRSVRRFVRTRKIPGVTFLGYLDGKKKKAALKDADVYLFPSTHGEGMPNSVLEAMAFGLPIVTTPVGGLPEFFEERKMGFWLDCPDAGCLARILEKLVPDRELRLKMGAYNAKYAREHFVATEVAQRLQGIWKDVFLADTGAATGRSWLSKIPDAVSDAVAVPEWEGQRGIAPQLPPGEIRPSGSGEGSGA